MSKRSLDELELQASQTKSSFENRFRDLHHFSQNEFSSKPSTFTEFVMYCKGLSKGILEGAENDQTIQRAHRYLSLLHAGSTESIALSTAWSEFPIITR